jgi:ribosomal protein L19E
MSDNVSVSEFAREVGASRGNVRRLIDQGVIPRNPDGTVPLEAGRAAFENRKGRRDKVVQDTGNVREETAKAKLAKETYIAKLKELDYRYRKGELVEVEDVRAEAQRVAAAVMDKFKAIPPRIAVLCEGRSARDIEAIISDAHNEAFAALHTKFK